MSGELQERILSITGHTSDINEALDEMESMKTAIGELYDENQAHEILNHRMRICLSLAEISMKAIQLEAGMFISEKARGKIDHFFEQYEKLQNTITLSREIIENNTK